MFTAAYFLELAAQSEQTYNERIAMGFGPGSYDIIRNNARTNMEQALAAAIFMEKNEIESAAFVGPYSSVTIAPGDKVRIKAGAQVFSYSEKLKKINVRARTVTVTHFFEGFAPTSISESPLRNPSVHWAGTNGYWCWVDANDVELV